MARNEDLCKMRLVGQFFCLSYLLFEVFFFFQKLIKIIYVFFGYAGSSLLPAGPLSCGEAGLLFVVVQSLQ